MTTTDETSGASAPPSSPEADGSAPGASSGSQPQEGKASARPLSESVRARAAELEALLVEMSAEPNLAASVIPEEFKASKGQLLDALIAAHGRQRAAEIEQIALVSGLCDAYSSLESNPGGDVESSARVLFGEHLAPPSMDGVPGIAEFFGHELGPALGISADAAWLLVWETLALRHRHPILWEHTLLGRVQVWRARRVARMCAGLAADLARRLDSELGPALPGWGPAKTETEVRAARARLDPEAETKRQEARRSRRVEFSPHEEVDGIARMEGLLDALDAHHLDGTLDQLAAILKKGGADGTKAELRAAALGHLAHPDRAARLLQPDLLDGASVTPDGHIVASGTGEIVTHTDKQARCRHGATIIVRLSGADLACRGGAELEGVGRITHAHLQELLASCAGFVKVRPVIDLGGPMSISCYRPSPELAWRVKERDGREMFPFSQRSAWSRGMDSDHTIPWADTHDTSLGNLGSLSRRTHRLVTHGQFSSVQEAPGRFRWTTPLGRTYWTSPHGTFNEPFPTVVSNDPCATTSIMLAVLLKAASAEASANDRTVRQRARQAERAAQQARRRAAAAHRGTGPQAGSGQAPDTPKDPDEGHQPILDPWDPATSDEAPPF